MNVAAYLINTGLHRFVVLPKRWIVERTLGWLNGSRHLAKDYEITTTSSEAMVQIAIIALLTRRLAQI